MKDNKITKLVSVVIPTYKPERTILESIDSIRQQTYQNIEIIVVDSNRSPMEKSVLKKLQGVRVITDGPERSIQRNRGMNEAKGEYILMVDQDMYLSKHVISECVVLIKRGYHALTIPEISVGEGFWAQCVALERYVNTYLERGQNECCRFFLRKDGLSVGGYDPEIVGAEDADFHMKLSRRGKIGKIRDHIVHDEGRVTFLSRVQKKYYYSKAFRLFLRRYPAEASKQFSPIKLTYFRHWKLFLSRPVVTAGVIMLRSAEVGAGVMGLLFRR